MRTNRALHVALLIGVTAGLIGVIAFKRRSALFDRIPGTPSREFVDKIVASPSATDGSEILRRSTTARRFAKDGQISAPVPTGAPFMIAPLRHEVVQDGDRISYKGVSYALVAAADGVVAEAAFQLPGQKASSIKLHLDSIAVGIQTIAQGTDAKAERGEGPRSLVYHRGTVDETYVLGPQGFEQSFVIRELPAGGGTICVRQTVSTNLKPPSEGTVSSRLAFTRENQEVFEVSHAAVVDARGRKLPLELAFAEGQITMTVPASWVAEATLPIVVDPIIGSPIQVSQPNFGGLSAVAFNPDAGANEWMVVWERQPAAGGDVDLLARRINSQGQVIGAQIDLAVATGQNHISPAISYAPAPVSKYLVVWQEYTSGGSGFVGTTRGRLLNADGSLGGPIFTVDSRSPAYAPAIAFDGTQWFVAFNDLTTAPAPGGGLIAGRILGRFVATNGTPGNAADPSPVIDSSFNVDVAFTSGSYAICWGRGTGPADAVARTMDTGGNFTNLVTVLDQTSEAAQAPRVSAKAGGFLFVWEHLSPSGSQKSLEARLSDASLTFAGNSFAIPTGGGYPGYPRVSLSATDQQWAAFYSKGPDVMAYTNVFANGISTLGATSAAEQVTFQPTSYLTPSGAAWNSSTDEFLVVFSGVVNGVNGVYGQRYGVPGGAYTATFEGRWRFDEGSGTFTADSSGSGNDGTLVGGVSWTAGKSGSAISLDGVDDYVSVIATGMPAANAAQSISWWMNYASVPTGNQSAIGLTNNSAGSAVQCGFRGGQVTVWKYGGGILAQAPAPSAGAWHHFSYTFDGTTHRLYVDGALISSSTAASQAAVPDTLQFGRWSGGSEYFAGKLDEVSISGRALTPAQIADLAAIDPSVKAYFKFNEGSGTSTADSSGNGHNGTLISGVTWGPGRSGNAVQLDGSSGSISCVLGTGLPANNAPQTISWWMNYPSTSGVQAAVCLTNPGAGSAIQTGFRNGQVTVWNWGGNTLVSAPPPAANSWHHFAYSFDGATHSLYVDGSLASSSTVAAQTAAPSRLDFGFTPGWGEFFGGRLDEVRIYDRALAPGEVASQAQTYSLEAYFRFDEGTGTLTADASGNGHDGTLNGTAWAVGQAGSALQFDGAASNVSCALASGLPANNANQTVSWWMNYPSVPSSVQAVVCLTNPSAGSAIQTGFRNGQVTVWNWGGNTLTSAAAPSANMWHHFAYTFDGTTHSLYVDGSLVNTSTAGAQGAAPSRLDFGLTPGWGEYYSGLLDEVRIYSRRLSAGEIAALAQDPSLAAYFKFDEATGSAAVDSSGNGHDGTLSSGVARIAGVLGGAISLDGTGYVACAVRTGLPSNNARQSVTWWMNVASNPSGVQTAFDLHNDAAASSVQGGFRNGNVTVWNHGGNVLAQAAPPAAGAWHHYAYTFNGTTHRLYVDGVEAGSSTTAPQTAAVTSLVFGRWNGGSAEYLNGSLDDLRIYSRVFTAAELQSMFQAVMPAPVITAPAPGTVLPTSTPTVAGTSSSPGLLITLYVDGIAKGTTTSVGTGSWSLVPQVPLIEGPHTLTATASNGAQTSGFSSPVGVTVDLGGPTLAILTPADGALMTNRTPLLAGSWSDSGSSINIASASITLDGASITGSSTITATGFRYASPTLSLGSHSVSMSVMDLAGHTGTLNWTFTIEGTATDVTAPVISNLSPANGSFMSNRRPPLSAVVTDAGGSGVRADGIILTLNGVTVPAVVTILNPNQSTVSFIPPSNLGEGQNSISVSASDNSSNAVGPITATFTIDATPPGIVVTAPVENSNLSSTAVQVNASVTDASSGPSLGSVQVLLNGEDRTTSLSITANPDGSLSIQGTLTGRAGSNELRILATDNVGNATETVVPFSVGAPGDESLVNEAYDFTTGFRNKQLSLQVVSPSASVDVLSGRIASELLTVGVSNQTSPGGPAAGVPVDFEVISGSGYLMEDGGAHSITDGAGSASMRFVAGPRPGPVLVRASVRNHPEASPVQFQLSVKQPNFGILTVKSSCNFGTFADRVGSAFPELLVARIVDHNGQPIKGAAIKPRSFIGTVEDIGHFLPEMGVSDDNGLVRFAFVIDQNATDFTMELSTVFYQDANGDPLKDEQIGQVIPGSGMVSIEAGQSQIGAPGLDLDKELRVHVSEKDRPVMFTVLEGTALLSQGTYGGVMESYFNSCGKQVIIVSSDTNTQQASVKCKPTSGSGPILIDVGPASDVFAIGMPEGKLVSAAGSDVPAVATDRPDGTFRIEYKVPVNIGTVTAKIKSLDPSGAPISLPIAVAPTALPDPNTTDPPLAMSVAVATGDYNLVRSEVLVAVTGTTVSGPDASSLPGKKLQVILGAILSTQLMTPKGDFEGRVQAAAQIKRDQLVNRSGAGKANAPKFKLTLTNAPGGDLSWTIKSVAGTVLTPVNADGTALANAKQSELWLQFVAFPEDVDMNQNGKEATPVRVRADNDVASRRAQFEVSVKKAAGGAEIDKRTIFIVTGSTKNVDNAVAPPATDAAVQGAYGFWKGKEPDEANALPGNGKFAPIGTAAARKKSFDDFKTSTGKELDVDKRIFVADSLDKLPTSYAVTRVVPMMTKKIAVNEFEWKSVLVQGTVISVNATGLLDTPDMDVVALHEQRHVESGFGMLADATNLQRRLLLHIYNQFWGLAAADQTLANRTAAYDKGVLGFHKPYDEVTVRFQDLVDFAPAASKHSNYLLLTSHVPAYAGHFGELCEMLATGIPIAGTIKFTITDHPTEATQKFRTDFMSLLSTEYNGIPGLLSSLKGGKWNVKAGVNRKTVDPNATVAGEYVLLPVEE